MPRRRRRSLGDFDTDLIRRLVSRVEVRSEYGPDLDFPDPFAPSDPASTSSQITKLLKPTIRVFVGQTPIVIAPAGEAGPTKWPSLVAAAKGLGLLAAFGVAGLIGLVITRKIIVGRRAKLTR